MGPGQNQPGDNDDGEDKIVEDAAELPKAEGIGEEGAGGDEWGLRKSWRWFGLRSLHGNEYGPLLSNVKYFV